MRKLLSYIYPITKKITSKHNGELEITWYNGKKHLNSKNANYSYGSLQKILKIGLQKIDLKNCKEILILGMGGGSVIKTLRDDFNYQHQITAVEIDPTIIKIADEEFDIRESKNLNIICDDAQLFMQLNTKKFDLAIIDLYIDTKVPNAFLEIPFWKNLSNAVSTILCNASLELKNNDKLATIKRFLKSKNYQVDFYEKVNGTNTLLVANKENLE
ncbi:methyltransferase domain-containing protein [Aureibaculum sp. 2210JD6-5]|uniref:spermidine synthase n=1 Tax=Aureibaculum sp. 2210JD6-5 TaxID=3103957 RepID=UPI002AAE9C93|nr:methyltransferase domain-containing protein [Aureibaculum sp. 2210JD6-5]MDY7395916.1 methyltransferase domain-containing protein [Aureibaculum sp. 2210JD6-5]